MRLNRTTLTNPGSIFFRATLGILDNPKGFADSLKNIFFRFPAIAPSMPWLDSIPPLPPLNLTAIVGSDGVILQWQRPSTTMDGDSAHRFVIYKTELPDTINTNDPRQILAITDTDMTTYADSTVVEGNTYSYAITSLDKLNNESNGAAIVVPAIHVEEQIAALPGFLLSPSIVENTDSSITIHFTLQEPSQTSLILYDIFNREVAVVVNDILEAGEHSYRLYTQNLSEGIYYTRMISGVMMETKKIFIGME
jgi:hypothetical protein